MKRFNDLSATRSSRRSLAAASQARCRRLFAGNNYFMLSDKSLLRPSFLRLCRIFVEQLHNAFSVSKDASLDPTPSPLSLPSSGAGVFVPEDCWTIRYPVQSRVCAVILDFNLISSELLGLSSVELHDIENNLSSRPFDHHESEERV